MHHPRDAGGDTAHRRVVLQVVVVGARRFAGRRQRHVDLRVACEDPDAVQFGASALGGQHGCRAHGDQCRADRSRAAHFARSGSHSTVSPLAIASRNAAKPQSRSSDLSGSTAVRKYARLSRERLGLALMVTVSPTRSSWNGTLRRTSAFLSDHSISHSFSVPSGWRTSSVIREWGLRMSTSFSLPLRFIAFELSKFTATEWWAGATAPSDIHAARPATAALFNMQSSVSDRLSGDCNALLVGGWWLVVGGWWLVVGG